MNVRLGCAGYTVYREMGNFAKVHVDFVILEDRSEQIARALRRLELYLSGEVNLVRACDRPRCFYCGVLAAEDDKTCLSCGAPL